MTRPKRPREDAQAYHACVLCGQPILSGETVQGQVVHLDVSQACYCVA
jgi:hypothetical protein